MKLKEVKREDIVPFETRPTDSAHASTLLELKNGEIISAWFGGSWEKDSNVDIYMAKRSLEGVWSYPEKIAQVTGIAMWNPVLFRYPDESIVLFFKVGEIIEKWKTFYIKSVDEGKTWSKMAELVEGDESGGRGPVKNKPIMLNDGKTVLAPASIEGNGWQAFVDISTDNGKTWAQSDFVPIRFASYNIQMVDQPYDKHRLWGKGMIQPTLWQDKDGACHMFTRTTSSAIFRSDSLDNGRTWNLAYDTGLPNNNSGIDLVRMSDGTLVLAHNPVGNLPNYYKGPRTPLVLSYSEDNGATWKQLLVMEDGPGGYAYPAIIEGKDGSILVTYTHKRERIIFYKVEVEK